MRPLVISLLLATIAIAHPSIKHTHTRRKLHKPASLPYSDHGSDMNSLTPKNSTAPKKSGCHYIVPSTGSFTHKEIFDFETLNTLPEELHADQYDISPANDRAYGYNKQNVVVTPKTLHLRVPGGQEGMIYNAQMCTTVQDILYGSVRTWAKISDVPGVCHGFFFYASDQQELDIEILTSTSSIHYTNQNNIAHGPGYPSTTNFTTLPKDAIEVFHEYRLDWTPGKTRFFIDGELQIEHTKNVAWKPGPWLWNNWSNGGKLWTNGPPATQSVLEISRIEMYFNRTSTAGECAAAH